MQQRRDVTRPMPMTARVLRIGATVLVGGIVSAASSGCLRPYPGVPAPPTTDWQPATRPSNAADIPNPDDRP